MKVEIHVLQGLPPNRNAPIDLERWQSTFAEVGLEASFEKDFDPNRREDRVVTVQFTVVDETTWGLGRDIIEGRHSFDFRSRACSECDTYEKNATYDEHVFAAIGSRGAYAAWLCAAALSRSQDRWIVERLHQGRIGGEGRLAPLEAFFVAKRTIRWDVARERTFVHPDGRNVRLSLERTSFVNHLLLAGDPEPVIRRRQLADSREVANALHEIAAELLADGFSETTDPRIPALSILNELLHAWRREDPTFDVEALAAPLQSERHEDLWEALHRLEAPQWIELADGSCQEDVGRRERDGALAHAVLLREDAATDAALLLALRSTARLNTSFRSLFGDRRVIPLDIAFPSLLSCLTTFHVSANSRPGTVASILSSHYRPLPDRFADQLLPLLSSPNSETRQAAAAVLADRARERRYFEPVWALRDQNEGMMLIAMAACEAQRDAVTLPWLEKLYKKRGMGSGWKERVDDTVARVRGEIARRPWE